MRLRFHGLLGAAILALLALPTLAPAGFVASGSNTVVILAPPRDLQNGQTRHNENIRAFIEKQNLTLQADLTVDFAEPKLYDELADLPTIAPIIKAGTVVNSYLFHTDPVDSPQDYSATLLFDETILGVIVRTQTLRNTDGTLGLAQLTYDTTQDFRGVDLAGEDQVRFFASDDGRKLRIDFHTASVLDEIRVVTAATPEPGSVILCVIGMIGIGGGIAIRRFRKR